MVSKHLDLVLKKLAQHEFDPGLDNPVKKILFFELQMELRFLKMFFCCCGNWDCTGGNVHLGSFKSELEVSLREMIDNFEKWEGFANQLLEKVGLFKSELKQICLDLLDCSSLRLKSSTSGEIFDFTVTVLKNLEDLLGLKCQMTAPVKDQIQALQQKLKIYRNLIKFSAESRNNIFENVIQFLNFGSSNPGIYALSKCVRFMFWKPYSYKVLA